MEEKGLLTSQQIYTKVGRPYKVYKLIKKLRPVDLSFFNLRSHLDD